MNLRERKPWREREPWPEARWLAELYQAAYGVVPDEIAAYVAELDRLTHSAGASRHLDAPGRTGEQ